MWLPTQINTFIPTAALQVDQSAPPARCRFADLVPVVSKPWLAVGPPSTPGVPLCVAVVVKGVEEWPRLCNGGGGSAGPSDPTGATAYRSSFGFSVLTAATRVSALQQPNSREQLDLRCRAYTHLVFTCCLAECLGNEPRICTDVVKCLSSATAAIKGGSLMCPSTSIHTKHRRGESL